MADFSFIKTTAAAFVASAVILLIANEVLKSLPHDPGLAEYGAISVAAASVVWIIIIKTTPIQRRDEDA